MIGETQQLVLTALYLSNTNTFSISNIIVKLKELGYNVTHDMIFSAIKRLMKRGIVEKLKRGEYILTKDIEGLVQNVKVIPKKVKGTRRKPKNIPDKPAQRRDVENGTSDAISSSTTTNSGASSGNSSTSPSSSASSSTVTSSSSTMFRFTLPLDKFLQGDYKVDVEIVEKLREEVERSVGGGNSSVSGKGFEVMFDNIHGTVAGYYLPWLSKKRGGRRLTREDIAVYDKITYAEIDFVDKDPEYIPIFFTKIYYDKKMHWLIVEMLPPRGFVRKHGLPVTFRLAVNELVTLIVYIAGKLLYTVKGRLRKRLIDGLRRLIEKEEERRR